MDQEAFTSFITRNKAALANQEADPMTAFSDSINVALYNRHPRALSMKADMLDKIDYNKVMEFYKNRFADASDFTFILVGNVVDHLAAEMGSRLRQVFGSRILGPDAPPVARIQLLYIRKIVVKIEPGASLSKVREQLLYLRQSLMAHPDYRSDMEEIAVE